MKKPKKAGSKAKTTERMTEGELREQENNRIAEEVRRRNAENGTVAIPVPQPQLTDGEETP